MLCVCPLPYPGLAPLQGPCGPGKCQEGASSCEIRSFPLSNGRPSLPGGTAGCHPQSRQDKVSCLYTCSAGSRLGLITSGQGGEGAEIRFVSGRGDGKDSDEAEEKDPNAELGDGKGTWALRPRPSRLGGAWRPERGLSAQEVP